MNRTAIPWILCALVLTAAITRWLRAPDPYRMGAAVAIDDRREHRFRNLSWAETERLLQSYLIAAEQAADPPNRARNLARAAMLQNERGFGAQAEAAAREALRIAPADTETRRILSTRLEVRAATP